MTKIIMVKHLKKWLEAKVSDVDYEYLSQFKWYWAESTKQIWRKRLAWEPKRYPSTITMSSNIMNFPKKKWIIRVNKDRFDLRRENLRLLSGSEYATWNHENRRLKKKLDGTFNEVKHPMDLDKNLGCGIE